MTAAQNGSRTDGASLPRGAQAILEVLGFELPAPIAEISGISERREGGPLNRLGDALFRGPSVWSRQ